MTCLMGVLTQIAEYSTVFYLNITNFIKSELFTGLFVAWITAFLGAYFGVKKYMKQQRIARIQKIYYEESLLDQINHMNEAINNASQNYTLFLTSLNIIENDMKLNNINTTTIHSLSALAAQVKLIPNYLSSKREVLIILFGKHGYKIHQWLCKYDTDLNEFNAFIREIILNYRRTNPIPSHSQLQIQKTEVDENFLLVQRHFILPSLLNEIISRIGTFDFNSLEQLLEKIRNDSGINDYLKKIDEVFKILFGWFRLDDGSFLSYLRNEQEQRFRLRFLPNSTEIRPDTENLLLATTEMRIIFNDNRLSNVRITLEGTDRIFSRIQLGVANSVAFGEQHFYPQIESFQSF